MADKSYQEGLTRSEAAARFGVSVSTIRTWQRKFKDWLEVEQQEYGGGQRQATRYSDNDLLVFSVVRRLTKEGQRYKDILEHMDSELAGATFELSEETPEEEKSEPGVSLVPWTQYSSVVAQLQGAEGKLEAIEDERNYLRERLDKQDNSHNDERERWNKELDEVRQQLDAESQKSWWQKLRGK